MMSRSSLTAASAGVTYYFFIIFFLALSLLSTAATSSSSSSSISSSSDRKVAAASSVVSAGNDKLCAKTLPVSKDGRSYWSYAWCSNRYLLQYHLNHMTRKAEQENRLDILVAPAVAEKHVEYFKSSKADCKVLSSGKSKLRKARVHMQCCKTSKDKPLNVRLSKLYIDRVEEAVPCEYMVYVCNDELCDAGVSTPALARSQESSDHPAQTSSVQATSNNVNSNSNSNNNNNNINSNNNKAKKEMISLNPINFKIADRNMADLVKNMDRNAQDALKNRVKALYYSAYDDYMTYAYPEGELRPISCTGGPFDLIKIPLVTLIDTLDTFVIMNNYSEFRNSVSKISNFYENFALDVNVSVFESTIRILGGLLSSHLFAIDEELNIYPPEVAPYDDSLLRLAVDIGQRLLPAFRTQTGIPYGTVNLRYGVPKGETEVASTAGAGSLVVEFYVLSQVSGDPKFFAAAMKAVKALYGKKSPISLLGKHIHTKMGRWSESVSGIGSNSDSFYEYLWKSYLLSGDKELFEMFIDTFTAIKRHVQEGDWFGDVDMFTGKSRRNRVENLHAFWPGLESSMGYVESSARLLNALFSVWNSLGFVPEELDQILWMKGKPPFNSLFPLRPELIESTYFHYRSTGDRSWLVAGEDFLNSIEQHTKSSCGYAAVANVLTRELDDIMPSFFLAETCKYLYLLFDEDNVIHNRPYIFSTEAHPFSTVQLAGLNKPEPPQQQRRGSSSSSSVGGGSGGSGPATRAMPTNAKDSASSGGKVPEASKAVTQSNRWFSEQDFFGEWISSFPKYCPARIWWDIPTSYDLKYISANYISVMTETPPPSKDVVESLLLGSGGGGGGRQETSDHLLTKESSPSIGSSIDEETFDANAVKTAWRLLDISLGHREHNYHNEHIGHLLSNEMLRADERFYKIQSSDIDVLGYDLDDPIDDSDRCFVQPFVQSSTSSGATNEQPAGTPGDKSSLLQSSSSPFGQNAPVQSIEIPMGGDLGTFLIRVFASGFQVISKSLGNALEVTNIGQHEVFVREYNETSSQSVVGTRSFQSIRCMVDVLDSKLSSHWRKHCSVSTFGAFTPIPLVRTITVPPADNAQLCREVKTEQQKKKESSSWWPFNLGSKKDGDNDGDKADKGGSPDKKDEPPEKLLFENQIVMGMRGDCMFEEKTLNAQHAGAVGLLVMNTEDSIFIMSGKKVSEDHAKGVPVEQQNRYTSAVSSSTTDPSVVRIPVAMLSKVDANSMSDMLLKLKFFKDKDEDSPSSRAKAAMYEQNLGASGPFVSLNLKSVHSQLDTETMGSFMYPKIIVQQNAIAIRGNDKWGAILTSNTGPDWQLMVVSASALKDSEDQMHSVFTRTLQPVCTTSFFSVDPILQYELYLSSACPVTIEERIVGGSSYVVLNEFGYTGFKGINQRDL